VPRKLTDKNIYFQLGVTDEASVLLSELAVHSPAALLCSAIVISEVSAGFFCTFPYGSLKCL